MTERRRALRDWSPTTGRGDGDWRRNRDPIGRHTMIAAVLGVIAAALIGLAADPFNFRTSDDLRRAEELEYRIAYAAIADEAYADGQPYGRLERLGLEIVNRGEGIDTLYGAAYAEGWTEGWNESAAAMREAAEAAGLPAGYTEFEVLDGLGSR